MLLHALLSSANDMKKSKGCFYRARKFISKIKKKNLSAVLHKNGIKVIAVYISMRNSGT